MFLITGWLVTFGLSEAGSHTIPCTAIIIYTSAIIRNMLSEPLKSSKNLQVLNFKYSCSEGLIMCYISCFPTYTHPVLIVIFVWRWQCVQLENNLYWTYIHLTI